MKKLKKILIAITIAATFLTLFCGCTVPNLETIYNDIQELKSEVNEVQASLEQTPEPVRTPEPETEGEEQGLLDAIKGAVQEILDKDPDAGKETTSVVNNKTVNNKTVNNKTVNNTTVVNVVNNTIEEKPGVDKESETILSNFTADEMFFVADESATVTFTVAAVDVENGVQLCCDRGVVATMYDGGAFGDVYAGDGIYTAVWDVKNSAGAVEYWAVYGNEKSESFTLYFFEQPTEESAHETQETTETIQTALAGIETSHMDESGYVPENRKDAVMDEISAYLEDLYNNGTVLLYDIDEDTYSVDMKLTSGLTLAYALSEEDTDRVGNTTSVTIYTCQPQFQQMGGTEFGTNAYELPDGVDYVLEMPDAAAADVDEEFSNYTFSENHDEGAVSLELIRSFGANQVILWHGHGYYGPIVKSCLCTGEPFSWDTYFHNFGDCVTNRIVNGLFVSSSTAIISSGYIEKYCTNLDNSFIYLAACYSGTHNGLAQAFLDNGAVAVVGNTDSILRAYNVAMMYGTAEKMTEVNHATNNYYTLSEALQAAKDEYGSSDADPRYMGVGAKPVIFGGAAAENYRFGDRDENTEKGTLSGKVCQAADRITPVTDATIRVFTEEDTLERKITVDETGSYTLELPEGDYRIEISAVGYITFSSYTSVTNNTDTYLETFLLVDEGEEGQMGIASGRIYDAITGLDVEDVELLICEGWNNSDVSTCLEESAWTDESGEYEIELPLGNYTLNTRKDGYINNTINIVVRNEPTAEQNGAISPEGADDEYRVVLSWGLNPRDLDAHVVGPKSDGSLYHVYYHHKNQIDGDEIICNLDVDDTSSYGPETITLTVSEDEPYYYFVHKYAGTGTLATSEAQVKVYHGEELIATYHVPTSLGDENYWNVFALRDGELIPCNTITRVADTDYAGRISDVWEPVDDVTDDAGESDKDETPDDNEIPEDNEIPDEEDAYISESENDYPEDAEEPEIEDEAETEYVDDGEDDFGDNEIPDEDDAEEGDDVDSGEEPEEDDESEEDMIDEELQAAYAEMLETWQNAVAEFNELTFERLSDYDDFEEKYSSVNFDVLLENDDACFAYAYLDIDGNDTEELIIGIYAGELLEYTNVRVVSIYGYDGENAVELDPELRGTYMMEITIYEDGCIWLHNTIPESGASDGLYEIAEDGYYAEMMEVSLSSEEYVEKTECELNWRQIET